MLIVVHPVKFELESFSTSEECRKCGATPNHLGVRPNVDISKEHNALVKEIDKNSRSRRYRAVAATQEPTSATNREDVLLSLMQEVCDALKKSSLTAWTTPLANSVVASSISPNDIASMIGSQNSQNSTVLAQAVNTQDVHHSLLTTPGVNQCFSSPTPACLEILSASQSCLCTVIHITPSPSALDTRLHNQRAPGNDETADE